MVWKEFDVFKEAIGTSFGKMNDYSKLKINNRDLFIDLMTEAGNYNFKFNAYLSVIENLFEGKSPLEIEDCLNHD